jgi:hypothetical protein
MFSADYYRGKSQKDEMNKKLKRILIIKEI